MGSHISEACGPNGIGMRAVIDTNILIDYLNGIDAARVELARYDHPLISVITEIEVLAGVRPTEDEQPVRQFLSRFEVCKLNSAVAEQTILLRRNLRIKVPDAIIYATAKVERCLLVTRNTRDFSTENQDVREPYRV